MFVDDNFIVNEGDGERRKKRRNHKKDRNIPEGYFCFNFET